mmetsp:Transcript_61168/g.145679  ORF Transcript_61168/g.145679 Transcript_61168/m.145679 type:complete len:122 (+) Transcript_61168:100-465(+)
MDIVKAIVLLVCLALLLYYGRRLLQWGLAKYRLEKRLDSINEEYERLRQVRQDVVYHHGWATSRGDHKEAESHEKHVIEIDEKLEKLRDRYDAVKAGQDVELEGGAKAPTDAKEAETLKDR